jgi:hypothetical protein
VKRAGVEYAGVKRAGVEYAGVKRAGVDYEEVKRAGVELMGQLGHAGRAGVVAKAERK